MPTKTQPPAATGSETALDLLVAATKEQEYVPGPADVGEEGALENVGRVEEYLQRFGYIRSVQLEEFGPAAMALGADLPESAGDDVPAVHAALRRFQEFNNLPVTGDLDEATLRKMSLPRCGFPDLPPTLRSAGPAQFAAVPTEEAATPAAFAAADGTVAPAAFTAQGSRWANTALTYGFQNFSGDLTQAQIRAGIQQALGLWSAVTPLTFTEVAANVPPDLLISFASGNHGDGNPFDGAGGVLAHAYYPPPGGGPLAGDLHFDDAETWTVNLPPSGTDLVTVAAHEFGHALGLAHSTVQGALMAPFYNGAHRQLEADDIAGIQSIYGQRGGWASLGGVITSRIAVARNMDGRLEVFARGQNNALWHIWQTAPNSGWSGWASLGGVITSDPTVIANQDGRLEVFARGQDNAVWHIWQTAPSNGWSNWASLGGGMNGNVGAGRNLDGRLELVVWGTNNAVWHRWQTAPNSGWSPSWISLGGGITSNPTVASNADGRLEIFARGLNNAVWHRWQTAPNSGWSANWVSLGGGITGNIAAARNADGRMELFVRGTDNALWHRWQTAASNGWSSSWASLGGGLTDDPRVYANADGRLEVFVRGTDNAVWHRWQTAPNSGWANWGSLGGGVVGPVAGERNADGRLELFVQGTDNAVWHRWQTAPSNGWS